MNYYLGRKISIKVNLTNRIECASRRHFYEKIYHLLYFQPLTGHCTFNDGLDKGLLSSITCMQAGKGMISEESYQQYLN